MRKYIREMVLEAICKCQKEWFKSRDLVNELSEKLERKISTHEIACYIGYYWEKGFIRREPAKYYQSYKYKIINRNLLCK